MPQQGVRSKSGKRWEWHATTETQWQTKTLKVTLFWKGAIKKARLLKKQKTFAQFKPIVSLDFWADYSRNVPLSRWNRMHLCGWKLLIRSCTTNSITSYCVYVFLHKCQSSSVLCGQWLITKLWSDQSCSHTSVKCQSFLVNWPRHTRKPAGKLIIWIHRPAYVNTQKMCVQEPTHPRRD